MGLRVCDDVLDILARAQFDSAAKELLSGNRGDACFLIVTWFAGDALADDKVPNVFIEPVGAIPHVHAAGAISILPIDRYGPNEDVHICGQPEYPKNVPMLAEVRYVTPGYLAAMGIRQLRGRALSLSPDPWTNKADTVIVNQAFVHQFIPSGLDPTPQRINDCNKVDEKTRIVGVVTGVRQTLDQPSISEMDFLADELLVKNCIGALNEMWLVVRYDGNLNGLIAAPRCAMRQTDPRVPFEMAETMQEVSGRSLIPARRAASIDPMQALRIE